MYIITSGKDFGLESLSCKVQGKFHTSNENEEREGGEKGEKWREVEGGREEAMW